MRTMDAVDAELGVADGPFFLPTFSLVDCTFAPFLERIAASILYYKGFVVRGDGRWPNLERWFAAMEERPAYLGFKVGVGLAHRARPVARPPDATRLAHAASCLSPSCLTESTSCTLCAPT